MRRFRANGKLQHAAVSTLLLLAGSSSHRVGGAGGGGIGEIVDDVVALNGLEIIVASMQTHPLHAGLQQQACSLLLAMAELRLECREHMVEAGVQAVVMAAIQRDVLCEMRMSLQCARNLLQMLCPPPALSYRPCFRKLGSSRD